MIKLEKYAHASYNYNENEFTCLIRHLDGIVLWQEDSSNKNIIYMVFTKYLQILKRGGKALVNYITAIGI